MGPKRLQPARGSVRRFSRGSLASPGRRRRILSRSGPRTSSRRSPTWTASSPRRPLPRIGAADAPRVGRDRRYPARRSTAEASVVTCARPRTRTTPGPARARRGAMRPQSWIPGSGCRCRRPAGRGRAMMPNGDFWHEGGDHLGERAAEFPARRCLTSPFSRQPDPPRRRSTPAARGSRSRQRRSAGSSSRPTGAHLAPRRRSCSAGCPIRPDGTRGGGSRAALPLRTGARRRALAFLRAHADGCLYGVSLTHARGERSGTEALVHPASSASPARPHPARRWRPSSSAPLPQKEGLEVAQGLFLLVRARVAALERLLGGAQHRPHEVRARARRREHERGGRGPVPPRAPPSAEAGARARPPSPRGWGRDRGSARRPRRRAPRP